MLAINVKGPWLAAKYASPLLREGSSIIVNTSVVGTKGIPGAAAYGASKAAARAIVRHLAAELSPRGIRVNAVSPGPVETPIYGKMGLDAVSAEAFASGVVSSVPLGRFGQPDEIAHAVLFLASAQAGFIQGVELAVDGGFAQV